MNKIENVIIVRNKTRLEQLTERFNTQDQARFYIKQSQESFKLKKESKGGFGKSLKIAPHKNDSDFSQYEVEHRKFYDSLKQVQKEVEKRLKFKIIFQDFLPTYIFSANDLVIVIGQDGLVANTAKYVHNIPILAINPDSERYDGVLLPFRSDNFFTALDNVISGNYNFKMVTMAETVLNDGQKLLAFNDFFIGPSSHSSARYEITFQGKNENQSSSGIIVSTGAGSTGWLSSLFNMANSIHSTFHNTEKFPYQAIAMDEEKLVFVVREPFLSKSSQINIASGIIYPNDELVIESHMPKNGLIFSDGIQTDFLQFNSGAIATIKIANEKAKLVIG
ncbi:MAG: NAD(+)/NADH kinase [Bacteroidales bacterium]|nr:NAD(+)/NADH kinase [Bacteroidales bacterium]MBN2757604.1 NAD(+)/NADH kinase [Bacteroidales bacterium]